MQETETIDSQTDPSTDSSEPEPSSGGSPAFEVDDSDDDFIAPLPDDDEDEDTTTTTTTTTTTSTTDQASSGPAIDVCVAPSTKPRKPKRKPEWMQLRSEYAHVVADLSSLENVKRQPKKPKWLSDNDQGHEAQDRSSPTGNDEFDCWMDDGSSESPAESEADQSIPAVATTETATTIEDQASSEPASGKTVAPSSKLGKQKRDEGILLESEIAHFVDLSSLNVTRQRKKPEHFHHYCQDLGRSLSDENLSDSEGSENNDVSSIFSHSDCFESESVSHDSSLLSTSTPPRKKRQPRKKRGAKQHPPFSVPRQIAALDVDCPEVMESYEGVSYDKTYIIPSKLDKKPGYRPIAKLSRYELCREEGLKLSDPIYFHAKLGTS